jgi:hypothetical protein
MVIWFLRFMCSAEAAHYDHSAELVLVISSGMPNRAGLRDGARFALG